MMLQAGGAVPTSSLDLVLQSSAETKVVLVITLAFSVISWFLIALKWWQLRRARRQSDRFFGELERSKKISEAYQRLVRLPPSPFGRIFREAVQFCSDQTGASPANDFAVTRTLTMTQLEALKMVLGKVVGEERDILARGIPWLATIGAIGPLLGLLGTVLGVMDAFLGIAAKGSGNIGAVAPGVAEALVTTVAGLATAIPAVIGYNVFGSRVSVVEGELEGFASEIIGSFAREGML